jgi:hypothetical protein
LLIEQGFLALCREYTVFERFSHTNILSVLHNIAKQV